MDCKTKKYLHIYDWNYWWGYYRCGKDWDPFDAAEFSLSEDEAGEAPYCQVFLNSLIIYSTQYTHIKRRGVCHHTTLFQPRLITLYQF